MSSCSSEFDVIRTRISTYDDDDIDLYAYEPHTAYVNNVIYDAVQNLDKKFDVIHGKVKKLYRFHMKSWWQNRKLFGYAYKNYSYLLSKKIKYQKMRKKESLSPSSYPQRHSPTIPVQKPEDDSKSSPTIPVQKPEDDSKSSPTIPVQKPEDDSKSSHLGDSFQSHEALDLEQSVSLSPKIPTHSHQQCCSPENPLQGCSSPSYHSPEAHNTCSLFLATQSTAVEPATMVTQGERSPARNPDMMAYPALPENKRFSPAGSPYYVPTGFAPSYIAVPDPSVLKQGFSKDPSTWSVDEVIQFMKHKDPQISGPLANLFMQHDIDGKALLLLKSDMMMKYMGLKLGTAVKLCHYIERLKTDTSTI
ncbi:sex comb on midleg-like protein 1 [Mesoplodon densirostris]|uniref:sex comb on midleg-like protein 1 n=1 Tax=Mesoplodon densirostris TaxID=48708 RepID=UPI0028DC38FA|nr:sex comb on midleg-like protein 1 [Mesoplodon densirostris]XP_059943035.1 sex comb on midleg-like protein 1 [Mesoplodon densirostris]